MSFDYYCTFSTFVDFCFFNPCVFMYVLTVILKTIFNCWNKISDILLRSMEFLCFVEIFLLYKPSICDNLKFISYIKTKSIFISFYLTTLSYFSDLYSGVHTPAKQKVVHTFPFSHLFIIGKVA